MPKYFREVNKHFSGDKTMAVRYMGVARSLLGGLVEMSGDLLQNARRVVLPDGTKIVVSFAGQIANIAIEVAGAARAAAKRTFIFVCSPLKKVDGTDEVVGAPRTSGDQGLIDSNLLYTGGVYEAFYAHEWKNSTSSPAHVMTISGFDYANTNGYGIDFSDNPTMSPALWGSAGYLGGGGSGTVSSTPRHSFGASLGNAYNTFYSVAVSARCFGAPYLPAATYQFCQWYTHNGAKIFSPKEILGVAYHQFENGGGVKLLVRTVVANAYFTSYAPDTGYGEFFYPTTIELVAEYSDGETVVLDTMHLDQEVTFVDSFKTIRFGAPAYITQFFVFNADATEGVAYCGGSKFREEGSSFAKLIVRGVMRITITPNQAEKTVSGAFEYKVSSQIKTSKMAGTWTIPSFLDLDSSGYTTGIVPLVGSNYTIGLRPYAIGFNPGGEIVFCGDNVDTDEMYVSKKDSTGAIVDVLRVPFGTSTSAWIFSWIMFDPFNGVYVWYDGVQGDTYAVVSGKYFIEGVTPSPVVFFTDSSNWVTEYSTLGYAPLRTRACRNAGKVAIAITMVSVETTYSGHPFGKHRIFTVDRIYDESDGTYKELKDITGSTVTTFSANTVGTVHAGFTEGQGGM